MQSKAFNRAVEAETMELRDQISMLRQQLKEQDQRLDAANQRFKSQKIGKVVATETEPADTTTQDTMVLVMAFLMAMMLGVVCCLCCHIRG